MSKFFGNSRHVPSGSLSYCLSQNQLRYLQKILSKNSSKTPGFIRGEDVNYLKMVRFEYVQRLLWFAISLEFNLAILNSLHLFIYLSENLARHLLYDLAFAFSHSSYFATDILEFVNTVV